MSSNVLAKEIATEMDYAGMLINQAFTIEDIAALIDQKLSEIKCICCHNAPDEENRAVICRKCYVVNSQLKAERDKAIEVLAQVQETLKIEE